MKQKTQKAEMLQISYLLRVMCFRLEGKCQTTTGEVFLMIPRILNTVGNRGHD